MDLKISALSAPTTTTALLERRSDRMLDGITRILHELKKVQRQRDECRKEIESLQRKEKAICRPMHWAVS